MKLSNPVMTDHAKQDRDKFLHPAMGAGMAGMYFGVTVGIVSGILLSNFVNWRQKEMDLDFIRARIAECPGKVVLLPDSTPECRPDIFSPIKRTKK